MPLDRVRKTSEAAIEAVASTSIPFTISIVDCTGQAALMTRMEGAAIACAVFAVKALVLVLAGRRRSADEPGQPRPDDEPADHCVTFPSLPTNLHSWGLTASLTEQRKGVNP